MKHIDYVVNLVGVDHVGFGWDVVEKGYDEGWSSRIIEWWRKYRPDAYGHDEPINAEPPPPVGLESYEDLPNLTRAL
jgi:microsomal dipeptidase-like Zn-dependent dipeptidase